MPVLLWVSCNLLIPDCVEKNTSAREQFVPKTNFAVSSIELRQCTFDEGDIRVGGGGSHIFLGGGLAGDLFFDHAILSEIPHYFTTQQFNINCLDGIYYI